MDGPRKHSVKEEKPDTEDHILFESIYMEISTIGKPIEVCCPERAQH